MPSRMPRGTPRDGCEGHTLSPDRQISPPPSPDKWALDERAKVKITQMSLVSAAVESGLRKQRDHLQAQLDKAAHREAMLEARVCELEEKLLMEDSVWSELAQDPRMTPEAMALQLRRVQEMQVWAQRAEADERQVRLAAEKKLEQITRERDAAQQQLAQAHAKLAVITSPDTTKEEIRQQLSQTGPGPLSADVARGASDLRQPRACDAAHDCSPIVSRNVLANDTREQGRLRLKEAMQEAYHRAGVSVHALRQRSTETMHVAPCSPRSSQASNGQPPAIRAPGSARQGGSSLPFDIDGSGRLLVGSVAPERRCDNHHVAQDSPLASGSDEKEAGWSSSDEDNRPRDGDAGPPLSGPRREGRGARDAPGHAETRSERPTRPMGAKVGAKITRHSDRGGSGHKRLSAHGGGAPAPDALVLSSSQQPAWWTKGGHADDDASGHDDFDDHGAAGTITCKFLVRKWVNCM